MLKSSFEFEVLIHGSSAREYYHQQSHYIEGKEGSKFSLRMRNNSSHRVLFVPTVDGLSIMNGKEASLKSKGYIVDAHDALTIDGWRTSDDKVAEFFFASNKNSYAKKMGRGGNLGVIGCAVFKEKENIRIVEVTKTEYIPYPVYSGHHCCHHGITFGGYCYSCNAGGGGVSINTAGSSTMGGVGLGSRSTTTESLNVSNSSNAFMCQSTPTASSDVKSYQTSATALSNTSGLGTGFGQDKYSPVVTVDFDKESSPVEVFSIYYNTRQNLEDMGIEFRKVVYISPSAFPKEEGYCERPY